MSDLISPELVAVLRRLKLSLILPTLPDRLALARQHKLPYQDLLLTVLVDEVSRRDSNAVAVRAAKARLDPTMRLERWDDTARGTFDRALLQELASLRFLDQHEPVAIIGPVGVGKTFLAQALGHLACARGATVLAVRTDRLLKTLRHARLDHTVEAEMRRLKKTGVALGAVDRGVAILTALQRRVVMAQRKALADLKHVIGHDALHVLEEELVERPCRRRPLAMRDQGDVARVREGDGLRPTKA